MLPVARIVFLSPKTETVSRSGDNKISKTGDNLPKRRLSPKQEKCRTDEREKIYTVGPR